MLSSRPPPPPFLSAPGSSIFLRLFPPFSSTSHFLPFSPSPSFSHLLANQAATAGTNPGSPISFCSGPAHPLHFTCAILPFHTSHPLHSFSHHVISFLLILCIACSFPLLWSLVFIADDGWKVAREKFSFVTLVTFSPTNQIRSTFFFLFARAVHLFLADSTNNHATLKESLRGKAHMSSYGSSANLKKMAGKTTWHTGSVRFHPPNRGSNP